MKSLALFCMAAFLVILGAGRLPAADAPAAASPADLKAQFAKELDALLPDMSSDDLGKRKTAQDKFSEMCLAAGRPGADAERAAICAVILPKLGADTGEEGRVWLLRQLQYVGRAEAVPAVAALLADKTPRIRECARRTLQAIPGDEAVQALRGSLAKADSGDWRVAMINALAQRGDAGSVAAIAKFLTGADEACALAAAAGLGKIGGPEAAAALAAAEAKANDKVRFVVQDSSLLCADQYAAAGKKAEAAAIYNALFAKAKPDRVRLAALRGLCVVQGEKAVPALAEVLKGKDEKTRLVALAFVQDISGPEATKAIAALVPNLEPPMQAALLGALGTRGDAAARPAVLKAAASADEAVRVAALKALAGVGGADDALLLAKTAAASEGAVRDAARASLAVLPGEKVDQALLAGLPAAAIPVRLELIGSLAARRTPAAIPVFAKLAEDQDDSLRGEALKGLEVIGNDSCIDLLVRLVKQPKKDNERDAAERALSAVCGRATGKDAAAAAVIKALDGTSGAVKSALLRPLGRIGGEKAVVPVRAALKDADAGVKDAAVRVISEWPDDAALDDMIGIAKDDPKTTNQVLALRGYVQHIRDRSEADRLKMCQAAMPLAKRPDEQKMILSVLRDLRSIEALRLAAPLIGEEKLKREAADAAVRIARNMGDRVPEEAKAAMEQALQATKDERLQREANEVLQRIERQKKK